MGADTSVVKKKREWNSMAGEEVWMEKHLDMDREGKDEIRKPEPVQ